MPLLQTAPAWPFPPCPGSSTVRDALPNTTGTSFGVVFHNVLEDVLPYEHCESLRFFASFHVVLSEGVQQSRTVYVYVLAELVGLSCKMGIYYWVVRILLLLVCTFSEEACVHLKVLYAHFYGFFELAL